MDGEATIQITYFTSGITWAADNVCIANKDETQMGFEGFVRVTNHSGEDYEDAQVRLVVGNINLVEKIAQLAHMSMDDAQKLGEKLDGRLRTDAAKSMMDVTATAGAAAPALGLAAEKQIITEG